MEDDDNQKIWTILVPVVSNAGKKFKKKYHREWDKKVTDISGGISVMRPAKGVWIDPTNGQKYSERMIPVQVLASRAEIEEIVDFTVVYYSQHAVLAYKVSDEVILRHNT